MPDVVWEHGQKVGVVSNASIEGRRRVGEEQHGSKSIWHIGGKM